MQKQRISGRVNGDVYEVVDPQRGVIFQKTLADARSDSSLAAAIARNRWEEIPEAQS